MSTQDANVQVDQEGSLRRIRSAGDVPRQPERAHLRPNRRISTDDHLPSTADYEYPSSHRSVGVGGPSSAPLPGPSWPRPGSPLVLDTHPPRQIGPMPQGMAPLNHQEHNHPAPPPTTPPNMPLYLRLLMYFGIGRRASYARKALASLIWNISWGFSQIITIVTILILTGTHFKSTRDPQLSEWSACDRPLGVWGSLWVFRVILASILAYWEYIRNRRAHLARADAEANDRHRDPQTITLEHATHDHIPGDQATNNQATNNLARNPPQQPESIRPPYSRLYSRLTLLSSLMTLSWVVTAHILVYTSIKTCRITSPHLWWLAFGILCIMYIMVLEVVILGIVVLIVAPILFIFWNIFLICIGRHPLQNPGIRPEIGKLPKSIVERIPLVMYIPPPPETEKDTVFQPPHSYPPKGDTATSQTPEKLQRRFKFLSNMSFQSKESKEEKANEKKQGISTDNQGPISWEENWEQGEYPFVSLEGNRASCAICLMDFEEPKRKHAAPGEVEKEETDVPVAAGSGNSGNSAQSPTQIASGTQQQQDELKLTDAGEGAQPLRLLACGHVFHKTCLDPWLTDVSGRCPVCQRPVEIPRQQKRSRRHT